MKNWTNYTRCVGICCCCWTLWIFKTLKSYCLPRIMMRYRIFYTSLYYHFFSLWLLISIFLIFSSSILKKMFRCVLFESNRNKHKHCLIEQKERKKFDLLVLFCWITTISFTFWSSSMMMMMVTISSML